MDKKASFILGTKDSTPIGVAFLFVFVSIGTLCHLHGFSLLQASAMSVSVFAAPLQIVLLQNPYRQFAIVIVLSFIINFRLLMMGFTIKHYFSKISGLKLWIGSLLLCTSTFVVSYTKFKNTDVNIDSFTYFLGVAIPSYCVAIMATMLGYFLMAQWHSAYATNLLMMILPIHFAGLTAKHWPKLKPIIAVCMGFIFMPVFYQWLPYTGEFLLPIGIGGLFVLQEMMEKKSGEVKCKSGY